MTNGCTEGLISVPSWNNIYF